MNTAAKLTLGVVAAVVVFAVGVLIGARVGAQQYVLLEGSIRASLLAGELSALRTGPPDKLIASKEMELDAEILRAMQFQDRGQAWMLWPESAQYEHTRYLKNAAAYRRHHPPLPPASPDFAEYSSSVRQATDRLLRAYGG